MQEGNHLAFEKLYLTYATSITSHLLYLLKSPELAKEVAQDTFTAVWEHRSRIDPERSFKSYLYKIATNKTYKLFRKAAYDQAYLAHLLPIIEEGYNPIESYIYQKENEHLLQKLLQQMPEKQRQVFILFKLEGYSYRQISEQLGISHSTINTHINRANQFLKHYLLSHPEYLPVIFVALTNFFHQL